MQKNIFTTLFIFLVGFAWGQKVEIIYTANECDNSLTIDNYYLKVCNEKIGRMKFAISTFPNKVSEAKYTPNKQKIITVSTKDSFDNYCKCTAYLTIVQIWNSNTGKLLHSYPSFRKYINYFNGDPRIDYINNTLVVINSPNYGYIYYNIKKKNWIEARLDERNYIDENIASTNDGTIVNIKEVKKEFDDTFNVCTSPKFIARKNETYIFSDNGSSLNENCTIWYNFKTKKIIHKEIGLEFKFRSPLHDKAVFEDKTGVKIFDISTGKLLKNYQGFIYGDSINCTNNFKYNISTNISAIIIKKYDSLMLINLSNLTSTLSIEKVLGYSTARFKNTIYIQTPNLVSYYSIDSGKLLFSMAGFYAEPILHNENNTDNEKFKYIVCYKAATDSLTSADLQNNHFDKWVLQNQIYKTTDRLTDKINGVKKAVIYNLATKQKIIELPCDINGIIESSNWRFNKEGVGVELYPKNNLIISSKKNIVDSSTTYSFYNFIKGQLLYSTNIKKNASLISIAANSTIALVANHFINYDSQFKQNYYSQKRDSSYSIINLKTGEKLIDIVDSNINTFQFAFKKGNKFYLSYDSENTLSTMYKTKSTVIKYNLKTREITKRSSIIAGSYWVHSKNYDQRRLVNVFNDEIINPYYFVFDLKTFSFLGIKPNKQINYIEEKKSCKNYFFVFYNNQTLDIIDKKNLRSILPKNDSIISSVNIEAYKIKDELKIITNTNDDTTKFFINTKNRTLKKETTSKVYNYDKKSYSAHSIEFSNTHPFAAIQLESNKSYSSSLFVFNYLKGKCNYHYSDITRKVYSNYKYKNKDLDTSELYKRYAYYTEIKKEYQPLFDSLFNDVINFEPKTTPSLKQLNHDSICTKLIEGYIKNKSEVRVIDNEYQLGSKINTKGYMLSKDLRFMVETNKTNTDIFFKVINLNTNNVVAENKIKNNDFFFYHLPFITNKYIVFTGFKAYNNSDYTSLANYIFELTTGKLVDNFEYDYLRNENAFEAMVNEVDRTNIAFTDPSSDIYYLLKPNCFISKNVFKEKIDTLIHFKEGFEGNKFTIKHNLVVANQENKFQFYNLTTGKLLYTYVFINDNEYIVYDEKNNYDASKNALKFIFYKSKDKLIPITESNNKKSVKGLVKKIMGNKNNFKLNFKN